MTSPSQDMSDVSLGESSVEFARTFLFCFTTIQIYKSKYILKKSMLNEVLK